MKTISNYKQHLEFEIRCPVCALTHFEDTELLLKKDVSVCPHCQTASIISDKFKNSIVSELPRNYIWHNKMLWKKAYTLFDLEVYEETEENCYGYVVLKDGKIWNEDESKVTMEILMIQHFIENDQRIEWADICIELVERFKITRT